MLSSRLWALGFILVATEGVGGSANDSVSPSASEASSITWRTRADVWHDAIYFAVQRTLRDWDTRLAREPMAPIDEKGNALPLAEHDEEQSEPDMLGVASPFRLELDLTALQSDRPMIDPLSADPLSADLSTDRRSALEAATRFDIDLRLPRLERRLRLFLTTDDLSETLTDISRDLRGGLRLEAFPDTEFEIGVKIDAPPVAFAALRWGEAYEHGNWVIHPFAKIFIDSSQGLGVGAALVLDRWQGKNFWRSSSTVLGLPRRSSTTWTQSWVWARTTDVLREGRPLARIGSRDIVHGWGLELIVAGAESRVEENEAALFFKRPLQSDWLFVSLRPFWRSNRGNSFPSTASALSPWRDEFGVTLGFDMLFWGPAGQGRLAPR